MQWPMQQLMQKLMQQLMQHLIVPCNMVNTNDIISTVVPTKSDSDILCLQLLLSKILTYTLHLSYGQSIDHLCINPILWIGLIHK